MAFHIQVEFVPCKIEKAEGIVILFRNFFDFTWDKVSLNMECKNGKVIKLWFLSRSEHYRIDSIEKWHEIGHALAPKPIWNDILENPGLNSMSITEAKRRDGLKGYIRVQVEPSKRVHPGIFALVNDHFEVSQPENTHGGDEIINILETQWESSLMRSNQIIIQLMEKLNGFGTK